MDNKGTNPETAKQNDDIVSEIKKAQKSLVGSRVICGILSGITLSLFLIICLMIIIPILRHLDVEKEHEGALLVDATVVEIHCYDSNYEENGPKKFMLANYLTHKPVFTNVVEFSDLDGGEHRVEMYAMVRAESTGSSRKKSFHYYHEFEVGSIIQVGYFPDNIEESVFQVNDNSLNIPTFFIFILGFILIVFGFFTYVLGIPSLRQAKANPILTVQQVEVPDHVIVLPPKVFSACKNLQFVKIPASVVSIGKGAIPKDVKIICPLGSYAEEWGKANNYNIVIENIN